MAFDRQLHFTSLGCAPERYCNESSGDAGSSTLDGLTELSTSLFRPHMTGSIYRLLGRALDALPWDKLRFYLESSEEVLCLLRDHTDWEAHDGGVPAPTEGKFLFGRDEARQVPHAILRSLEEISNLASATEVKVATVDNGLFANWLQVLDAYFFASSGAIVKPDWVLTGDEREFNYGNRGEDVFLGLYEPPSSPVQQRANDKADSDSGRAEPFVVYHRYNLMLVNVFRGYFLRGSRASNRRQCYAEVARQVFRPCAEALRARDEALATVPRAAGQYLIGVHRRVDNPGTARMQFEQMMATTDTYIEAVRKVEAKCCSHGAPAIIVLATDDDAAADQFREVFKGRIVCRSVRRCAGGINSQKVPVEVHGQPGRLKISDARDCLVDVLLLAACDALVHADSNVTIAAGIMNPDSECFHVRELVPEATNAGKWPGYRRCKLPS